MQDQTIASPTHINAVPLLISSVLAILGFLAAPVGLFFAGFNDSADPTINVVAYSLIIGGLLLIVAHCVVAVATTARYLRNKIAKWVFYLHVGLLASYMLAAALYGFIMALEAYGLFSVLYLLLGNVISGLAIACVTLSIILFVKRKTIV